MITQLITKEIIAAFVLFMGIAGATYGALQAMVFFGIISQQNISSVGVWGILGIAIFSVCMFFLARKIKSKYLDKHHILVAQYARRMPYAPLYIAKRLGVFRKYCLEVDFVDTGNDIANWEKVKSREVLLGVGDPLIFMEDQHNSRGKLICGLVSKPTLWGVSMKKLPRIGNLKALENKVIGVYEHPSTSAKIVDYLVEEYELKVRKIEYIRTGNELSQLDNSNIDLIFLTEPHVSLAEQKGAKVVLSLPTILDRFLMTGIYIHEDMLTEKKEITCRFVSALNEVFAFIKSNKAAALKIIATEFNELEEIIAIRSMLRLLEEDVFTDSSSVSLEAWQSYLKVRFRNCEMPANINNYIAQL